jgi:hypothetical protein
MAREHTTDLTTNVHALHGLLQLAGGLSQLSIVPCGPHVRYMEDFIGGERSVQMLAETLGFSSTMPQCRRTGIAGRICC